MRAVVKLGGALFPQELDSAALRRMTKTLAGLARGDNRMVLVAGGGMNARNYIRAARDLGSDESTADLLGIQITRANAELLRIAFEGYGVAASTAQGLAELPQLLRTNKIVILGGLQPGQSTNTVAALAAEIIHADTLVNATDVDGVYTEDPKKNPKAKFLKRVAAAQLLKMALAGEVFAGRYELLDPLAIKTLTRSKIPTRIVSILHPENIVKAANGESIGTLVVYE